MRALYSGMVVPRSGTESSLEAKEARESRASLLSLSSIRPTLMYRPKFLVKVANFSSSLAISLNMSRLLRTRRLEMIESTRDLT